MAVHGCTDNLELPSETLFGESRRPVPLMSHKVFLDDRDLPNRDGLRDAAYKALRKMCYKSGMSKCEMSGGSLVS
jgi:hypothetical protein